MCGCGGAEPNQDLPIPAGSALPSSRPAQNRGVALTGRPRPAAGAAGLGAARGCVCVCVTWGPHVNVLGLSPLPCQCSTANATQRCQGQRGASDTAAAGWPIGRREGQGKWRAPGECHPKRQMRAWQEPGRQSTQSARKPQQHACNSLRRPPPGKKSTSKKGATATPHTSIRIKRKRRANAAHKRSQGSNHNPPRHRSW